MSKGLGQSLDAFVGLLVVMIFGIGSFTVPAGQNWNDYQTDIATQDLTSSLKQSGHLEQFMRESNLGSLRTAVYEISDRNYFMAGTVENLPFSMEVGFYTPPSQRYETDLVSVESGDRCYDTTDINSLDSQSEANLVRTEYDNFNLEDETDSRLYLLDTDPSITGAYNGQLDFDTVYIDRNGNCNIGQDDGPFYIDETFLWGNPSTSDPEYMMEFKSSSVRPSDTTETYVGNMTTHEVPQIERFKDSFEQDIMGISSDVTMDSLTMDSDFRDYDVIVFRDRGNLNLIESRKQKVLNYAENGNLLFLMNPRDVDLNEEEDILRQLGFMEAGLEFGSGPETTCPTSGSATISSDCTYAPGTYLLDSLTVQSGVTVNIDNRPDRCDTTHQGYGCENLSYTDHSPRIMVKGDVEIDGTVNADYEGFRNATAVANRGGPGAGTSREVSGGGGYGGAGGNSDSYDDGGSSYGDPEEPRRLGSAGAYDINGVKGGDGGGSLWMMAQGQMRIDGTVTADGENSPGGAGGGAGGSIQLHAGEYAGTGTVSAEGGSNSNRGGGGGGGRISLIRESGSAQPFFTTISGGSSGSSGETGDDGSLYTDQRDFNMSLNINFSDTTLSRNLESYVVGQDVQMDDVTLYPEGNLISEDTGIVSERKLAYVEGINYGTAALNASNTSMRPVSDPVGEPDTACDSTTMGRFDFFPENSSIDPYTVINVELGTNQTYCDNRDIRGVVIDRNRDGNFSGHPMLLNTEATRVGPKDFRVDTLYKQDQCNTGECLNFVFLGQANAELVNYAEFNQQRVVRAAYRDQYTESDRKFIIGLMYWLRNGQPYNFGSVEESTLSSSVVGGVNGPQYIPYSIDMRWER